MTTEEIWLVTDSTAIAELVLAAVDQSPRFRLHQLATREFLSGNTPLETPSAILVDVGGFQAWEQLHECRNDRRLQLVPFIGIFDNGGIPLNELSHADQTFSAYLSCEDITSLAIADAIRAARLDSSRGRAKKEPEVFTCGDRRFVRCSAMGQIGFDQIATVAKHDIAVLLVGETGTGKTSIARMIHDLSPRCNGNLIHVACGALPKDLIDSELFGHVKGAFTGAHDSRIGKFEAAVDGTILLDEIDTLDLEQQAKLLRILESNEYEKLGSHKTEISNARVVVASNVCLEELVAAGRFRADLFYRLNQVKFHIPPLRERLEDLPLLVTEILNEFKARHAFKIDAVTPEFMDTLRNYSWPGNIRELRNELRRAALYCLDGMVGPASLNPHVREKSSQSTTSTRGRATGLSSHVEKTEREAIKEMLGMQEYNRTATAKALGISRVTLYKKIRKYGIRLDD